MKKVLIILVTIIIMATTAGCTSNTATTTKHNSEELPLVGIENDKQFGSKIETEEGITFEVSNPYLIGINGGSDKKFLFISKNLNDESKAELSCDGGKIIEAVYYESNGEIISSITPMSSSIDFGHYYDGVYCNSIKVTIQGNDGQMYSTSFYSSGA